MGRNGKKKPVFSTMTSYINANVGKIVSSNSILQGKKPGRNAETAYLYKFIKAGYVEALDKGAITQESTMYRVIKGFSEHYNSKSLMNELK